MAADIDPGGLQVTQGIETPNVGIGETNGALQLSHALAGLSDESHGFVQALGAQLQQRAEAKAQQDALGASGEAFANAVRDGKIEPTQSPWYIHAYNKDSAEVRARASISDIVGKSLTWAERSDPAAYANRLAQEVGSAAETDGAHSLAGMQGFQSAAEPMLKQAIGANQEYNVQRIQQEHLQDASSLMTSVVQDVAKANGGTLPPDKLWQALQPMVSQWVGTGGTMPQARMMMLNAIKGAAANLGNADLIDVTKTDFDGRGPLANMTDQYGQPVGQDLTSSKYYIDRLSKYQASMAMSTKAAQIETQGQAAYEAVLQRFGYGAINGTVAAHDVEQFVQGLPNVDPQAGSYAVKLLSQEAKSWAAYNGDMSALLDTNLETKITIANLYRRASQGGYNAGLDSDINRGLREGWLSLHDADVIDSKAGTVALSQQNRAESRAEHADTEDRATQRFLATEYNKQVQYIMGSVIDSAEKINSHAYSAGPMSKALRDQLKTVTTSAGEGWLATHPGDYQGAMNEAAHAATMFERNRRGPPRGQAPKPSGSGNPNGGGAQ
jgi:hypothetical protein